MSEAVVQLPHLTDEELEQLEIAVQIRTTQMKENLRISRTPEMQAELRRVVGMNYSLLTAIRETRMACALEQSRIEEARRYVNHD